MIDKRQVKRLGVIMYDVVHLDGSAVILYDGSVVKVGKRRFVRIRFK